MAHDLNDEDAAVRGSGGVDIIDALGGNVQSAVETECHICAVEVIIDGLGQCNDIEALFAEEIRGLGGAVAAAHNQAVKLQLMIGLLHCLDLVQSVLIGIADGLEGAPAGTEHCAAAGQDALEISAVQKPELAVDQALVAIFEAIELNGFFCIACNCLEDTAHCRVQRLAVAAGS